MLEVEVKGLAELREALLNDLPKQSLQSAAVLGSLRLAARPIVRTARQLAPVDTGRMRKAVFTFRAKGAPKTKPTLLVGVRSGKRFQKSGRDAYYWRFVEFGHLTRGVEGGRGGHMVKARPFMRPAFERNKRQAVDIFAKDLWRSIDKVAARAAARTRSARTGVARF